MEVTAKAFLAVRDITNPGLLIYRIASGALQCTPL